ncbi:MAG TPA: glycosyltransferase 87 family protein [Candidatus Peribacteraceae bacterium]|nr:glycosyltransferase 87 family protein [Candidatus Peribacteraceae bacterium]
MSIPKSGGRTDRLRTYLLLALVVALGLFLRLLLSPSPGYGFDVGVDQGWGLSAMKLGLAQSYVEQVNGNMLPNYAPLSIILFMLSAMTVNLFQPDFDVHSKAYLIAIKMPAIIADIGTALVLYGLLARWKNRKAGLIAALVYMLHPAVFHDSAFWGQTDGIYTFFMVAALSTYLSKRMWLSGALITLALLTKMQAVMLGPLFLVLFLAAGWKAFFKAAGGSVIVALAVLMPFIIGGTLHAVIDVYRHSVGYYSVISSAAYNFWWSMYADQAGNTHDTDLIFHVIPFRTAGLAAFGLSYLYGLYALFPMLVRALKDKQAALSVFVAAGFVSLSFFLWNTQMHERYLFPFVALALPMIFISTRGIVLYALISFLFYMNLLGWLPAGPIDKAIFDQFPMVDVFFASCQVILFFFLARYLWLYRLTFKFKKNPMMTLTRWRKMLKPAQAR